IPFVLFKYGMVKVTKKALLLICAVACSSIFLHQMTLAIGIQKTTAGNASLILGLNPLTTALLAFLFIGEQLNARKLLGIGLGFCGVIVVVYTQSVQHVNLSGWGDFFIFIAMLMYVIGGLLIKKVSAYVPILVITAYSHAIASLFLWSASFVELSIHPIVWTMPSTVWIWIVMFFSGWVATGICTLLWNIGIKEIGASQTAMFLNGLPLASLATAAIFLHEKIELVHIIAFLCVFAGIYLGTVSRGPLRSPKLNPTHVNK
ncbi:MAG: DMT family transporter, partial [Bacilli bacterium]